MKKGAKFGLDADRHAAPVGSKPAQSVLAGANANRNKGSEATMQAGPERDPFLRGLRARRRVRADPFSGGLIMSTGLVVIPSPAHIPAAMFAPTPKAAKPPVELFTVQINNVPRRDEFRNTGNLADVQPVHVTAPVKQMEPERSPRRQALRARRKRIPASFLVGIQSGPHNAANSC
jgi:hypothetical protein